MLDLEQISKFYPDNVKAFKRNILREYLQYKILDIIFNSKYANALIFMGGTAIRICYKSDRFSEDLDFDNFNLDKTEFANLISIIKRKLLLEGYSVEIRNVLKNTLHSYISFNELLYHYRLSGHREEKLLLRIDVETQSVKYIMEGVILNKFDVFTRIHVVPGKILLSQKLLAILYRKRPMGRDFYDVVWLLSKFKPDLNYLKSKAGISSMEDLKQKILEKCNNLDLKILARDIEQFLIKPEGVNRILLFNDYIRNI